MHQQQPSTTFTILVYVVVLGVFVYRMTRPRRMSVAQLAVMPFVLLAITALAVWGNAQAAALNGTPMAPPWQTGVALTLGCVLGIPLGILRGQHSEVRPADKPGVMFVHSSPLIIVVWLAAFALRALVRVVAPRAGPAETLAGDAALTFAVSALVFSYVVIYQRYRAALTSG